MKITDKNNNYVIAEDASLANTPFTRMKGLLGTKALMQGQALVLDPCNSVHTFFMRFPIDVVFIDKDNRVIKAISGLKPFRLTRVYFKAARCIELASGTIQSASIKESDTLLLE